jgi:hypothetical protein
VRPLFKAPHALAKGAIGSDCPLLKISAVDSYGIRAATVAAGVSPAIPVAAAVSAVKKGFRRSEIMTQTPISLLCAKAATAAEGGSEGALM